MTASTLSCAATDIGYIREKNEDAFYANDEIGLFVVADGIGGAPRGEIASALAVSAMSDFAATTQRHGMGLDVFIRDAVMAAHGRVASANEKSPDGLAMGTTVCAVAVNGRHFAFAGVGDSRCYLYYRSGGQRQLRQVSRDDTVAAALLDKGLPASLIRRSDQSTLTQAIGLPMPVQPQTASGLLEPGDALVLCSDGITDYTPEDAFRETIFAYAGDPGILARRLIEVALAMGGYDNCTCVCVLAKP
jgi:serine/threonine protein phosphatase PrpC